MKRDATDSSDTEKSKSDSSDSVGHSDAIGELNMSNEESREDAPVD